MNRIGDVIADQLQKTGSLASFQRIGDRRWVSEPAQSMRRIFEFELLKGNVLSARWGWSVDFVPLLAGHKLAWKRTAAKARPDLCIDPIDVAGDVPAWCSFPEGASPSRVGAVAAAAQKAANADWSKVAGLKDLIDMFEQRSKMSFRRFSLDNYAQTDLAWGLALLALGRGAEGESRLAAFCQNFGVDLETAILQKARAEAASMRQAQA